MSLSLNTRTAEKCLSFIRQVLSECANSLTPELTGEGNTLVVELEQLVTGEQNAQPSKASSLSLSAVERDLLRFVVGGPSWDLLSCVAEEGYGRLADIKRFAGQKIPNTGLDSAWERLFRLGLLYGENYSYLTSRGVAVYEAVSGKRAKPSKRDARLFEPADLQESVEILKERLTSLSPLSGGATLVLKQLTERKGYKLRDLRSDPLIKAYFVNPDELEKAIAELKTQGLVARPNPSTILLTPLSRMVAESILRGFLIKPTRKGDLTRKTETTGSWIDELIAHYESEGYRVTKGSEHPGLWGHDGELIHYDLYLRSDRKETGVLFPPYSEEASRAWFRNTLDKIMRAGHTLNVIGPSHAALERAKREVFDWLARMDKRRPFQMRFATIAMLKAGDVEELFVEGRY